MNILLGSVDFLMALFCAFLLIIISLQPEEAVAALAPAGMKNPLLVVQVVYVGLATLFLLNATTVFIH